MLANMSVLLTNNIQHVLIVNALNELQNESCSISRNKRDFGICTEDAQVRVRPSNKEKLKEKTFIHSSKSR